MGPAQELAALTVKSLLEGLAREEDILVLAGFVHAIQVLGLTSRVAVETLADARCHSCALTRRQSWRPPFSRWMSSRPFAIA